MRKPKSPNRMLSKTELDKHYAAMAADIEREREALEWCEALLGDAFGADRPAEQETR